MPYKILLHWINAEIVERHYIHAKDTRDAKRKSLKFLTPEILLRKIDYIRMSEIEVQEERGIFED